MSALLKQIRRRDLEAANVAKRDIAKAEAKAYKVAPVKAELGRESVNALVQIEQAADKPTG